MIRMVGTCWPARVDERVMEMLLNVVDDPLLEIRRIVREHSDAADRFVDDRFVARTNGLSKILPQQTSDTVCSRLQDRPVLLPVPSDLLACRAVCHAGPKDEVPTTERPAAHDTHAEIIERLDEFRALSTTERSVTLPHVVSGSEHAFLAACSTTLRQQPACSELVRLTPAFQPRRLIIAPAAVGCKRWLARLPPKP